MTNLGVCGRAMGTPGWVCARPIGHSGPCAAPRRGDFTPREWSAIEGELTQADVDRRTRELVDAYEPLPDGFVRPTLWQRWKPVLLFPATVRRLERVFNAQGEPWIFRWPQAIRAAIPVTRSARGPRRMPPQQKNPSAGASDQGSVVPPTGS